MISIRVKNFRNIEDSGFIEINKLNVFLGANSTGKSSLLRIFPLLKQTFHKKINGPILWTDEYVDFGEFSDVLRKKEYVNSIEIGFGFDDTICYRLADELSYFIMFLGINGEGYEKIDKLIDKLTDKLTDELKDKLKDITNYTIMLKIQSLNEKTDYIKDISIEINENKILIKYNDAQEIESIEINELQLEEVDNLVKSLNKTLNIKRDGILNINTYLTLGLRREIFGYKNIENTNNKKMIEELECLIDRILKEKVTKENIHEINGKPEMSLCIIIALINTYMFGIENYVEYSHYMAPLRSVAERYYRRVNLAIKEIDCYGKNLPNFLNSLKDEKFKKYQEWIQKTMGFKVYVENIEGHLILKIEEEFNNKPVNILDTGSGYSQILPILTQIWYEVVEKKGNKNRTISIEQPELHLHPRLQIKFIDTVINCIKINKVNFIIETHSEVIVNRIGELIYEEKISNSEVNLCLFEKNNEENCSNIRKVEFDSEGYLEDWPIGFFSGK